MAPFSSIYSNATKKANAAKKPKYKFGSDVTKKMKSVEGNIIKNVTRTPKYKFGADVTKMIKELEKNLMNKKSSRKEVKSLRDALAKIYSK